MSPMSQYVAALRSQVGHQPLLLPGVSVLVWDDDQRLLLVRQAESGQWSTVGGGVEPGESPADAARREVLEETGLDVELTSVRAAVGGPAYEVVYANGDRCCYVSTVFDAREVGGLLAADLEEVVEVRWMELIELATADITSYARALLSDLRILPG